MNSEWSLFVCIFFVYIGFNVAISKLKKFFTICIYIDGLSSVSWSIYSSNFDHYDDDDDERGIILFI